jgi:hypothetical protein
MTKIQIDAEVTNATAEQVTEITAAQKNSVDLTALLRQDAANRKIAYDKFIELGLTPEVALTISGWVENPTPPSDAQLGGN